MDKKLKKARKKAKYVFKKKLVIKYLGWPHTIEKLTFKENTDLLTLLELKTREFVGYWYHKV